jgi:hypothetical protein
MSRLCSTDCVTTGMTDCWLPTVSVGSQTRTRGSESESEEQKQWTVITHHINPNDIGRVSPKQWINFIVTQVSPKNVLLEECNVSYEYKTRSSKRWISESYGNQTLSTSPCSIHTAFDFDSVETPCIPLEHFVTTFLM